MVTVGVHNSLVSFLASVFIPSVPPLLEVSESVPLFTTEITQKSVVVTIKFR